MSDANMTARIDELLARIDLLEKENEGLKADLRWAEKEARHWEAEAGWYLSELRECKGDL